MSRNVNKVYYIINSILLILFALSIAFWFKNNSKNIAPINQYSPKVLVIYKENTKHYLDVYNNFNQSYILNTQVKAISNKELGYVNFSDYDIVYPDISLINSKSISNLAPLLTSYVENGGYLFLEYGWDKIFPEKFTGVISFTKHKDSTYSFKYPHIDYNLKQLQITLNDFLNNFLEYKKDDLDLLNFNEAKLNSNAGSIINIDNYSIMSLNKYKNGYVLMCSDLIPNNKLITGFDLTAKNDNQDYFDYSLSTINYFVRNEFLAFVLKQEYGFALKKIYGPYGRPAMAWQNHYEGLSSIKDKEMIEWIDLLKNYNEIPSMSLVRSAFDWGKWYSDITVHINSGTNDNPKFVGEYEDSYYSSGQRITLQDDYLTFGEYPNYRSLHQKIELPERAYPTVVDYENDGDNDLIVGAPSGKLYLVENVGTSSKPKFNNKVILKKRNGKDLQVKKYASPFAYDINNDGLFDLIVGDESGYINVFINRGSKALPTFSTSYKLRTSIKYIKVNGISTPTIGDIDNDNIKDLIVGSSSGEIYIYKGTRNGFVNSKTIITTNSKYTSPTVYDWNNDGLNDILIGDNSGYIRIYINTGTNFKDIGFVHGQTYNMNGNKNLLGGHNSVPLVADWNNDGIKDLIVGQLEFSIPYDIDGDFFKYKTQLREIIKYAKDRGVPIYPHIYTHKYRSKEQEDREIALHKEAFQYYGLDWNSGADQHTWQTNENNPQQTLISEMNSGIWWNFGFNPPNQPDFPREADEFLWSTPFLLANNNYTNNFIAFTPSPNLFMYPDVYNSFAELDMPITYFEHIEYRFKNANKLNQLKQMASFLDTLRQNNEYNFMTQEQMAKSFMNTFYSKAYVEIDDTNLTIAPDVRNVPFYANEYKGTLGIKLERGEKYKDTLLKTSSMIHYEKNNSLYFGLYDKVTLSLDGDENDSDQQKPQNNSFNIVRVNVPIKINELDNKTKIRFLDSGMQQIKIKSFNNINITGEKIKTNQDGNFYTVTHYGPPITITITN